MSVKEARGCCRRIYGSTFGPRVFLFASERQLVGDPDAESPSEAAPNHRGEGKELGSPEIRDEAADKRADDHTKPNGRVSPHLHCPFVTLPWNAADEGMFQKVAVAVSEVADLGPLCPMYVIQASDSRSQNEPFVELAQPWPGRCA
jgi:hypothetical protein